MLKLTVVISDEIYKLLGDLIRRLVVGEHDGDVLDKIDKGGREERA